MVNQDAKIGVGAVAVAGTLFVAYVLYKQWKKRSDEYDEANGDTVGLQYRRPGNRGRNGRNGRHVSDPGRMFYSTDKVMPVPSESSKEGLYKRHSTAGGVSQIPKPMGVKKEGQKDVPEQQMAAVASPTEPSVDLPKDERYEDAVVRKKAKKSAETKSTSPRPKSPLPPSEGSHIPLKTQTAESKPKEQSLPKPSQEQPLQTIQAVKTETVQSSPQSSPAKSTDGLRNEGGAGEEMSVPFDPHLLEDQMIGDSEGSDIGAGDTLAEDSHFSSKAGITLSPASSVEASPAKSPKPADQNPVPKPDQSEKTSSNSQPSSQSVSSEVPKIPDSESVEQKEVKPEETLDPEVISKIILQVQKSPNNLDKKVIKVLVDLLKVKEGRLLQTALESVVRCAAFSANQKVLRENGCTEELYRLLQTYSEAVVSGTLGSENILVSVNNAIMNLSMDVANQAKLQTCIPILIDLVMHEGLSSNVKLSSLQPLTNLATTNAYHGQYTRAIQQLYDLLDSGNRVIRIQSLKLLVNLSCNADMVKHLLAAKAPQCMVSLLEKTADPHLALRMVTLLANITSTAQKEEFTSSSLPPDDKAASPETMYSAIFGVNNLTQIRSKVYPLTRHDSEDISQQAAKLYNSLPNC